MFRIIYGLQVDTISTENSYNTKLLDATYDAMFAFEINTANEELSSVADSMRSMILASNNVLLNSLATNLGISNTSKEKLQPYIPAVLYTLYDGYYIYAPTETSKVARRTKEEENGLVTSSDYRFFGGDNGTSLIEQGTDAVYGDILYEYDKEKKGGAYEYTTIKENAKKETDYVLKSYVQYSARYVKEDVPKKIDVTINYTLDNYLNIVGTIDGVYYTKTGYLIKKDLVSGYNESLNEEEAKDQILGKQDNQAEQNPGITVNGESISADWGMISGALNQLGYGDNIKTISEAEDYLKKAQEEKADQLKEIQDLECEIGKYKAIAYYASSAIFSNWVYDNLGDLTYENINNDVMFNYYENAGYYQSTSKAGESDLYYSFEGNTTPIFNKEQDPEDTESNFNTHRIEVIKNSIKYNLNLAISAYCKKNDFYDFSLPVILDEEWDKIISNVSIVSFMQGWDCGLDIYNNYEMVSSTNNELMVSPSEIYYVEKEKFNNGENDYHRIDCSEWHKNPEENSIGDLIAFKSKEVKYDKVSTTTSQGAKYDHKNFACYTCINTNNYNSLFRRNIDYWEKPEKKYTAYYDKIASLQNGNLIRAGYIGIAKERQSTYKTNALPVSEGYKILINTNQVSSNSEVILHGVGDLEKVKELQITLQVTGNETNAGAAGKLQILTLNISDGEGGEAYKDIILIQSKDQTITVDVSEWKGENGITMKPNNTIPGTVAYTVKSVKAIYK